MNKDLIIAARRIAREMIKCTILGPGGTQYFIGLGVALGIIWEISHGHIPGEANKHKPQEMLEWAKGLEENKIIISN